MTRRLSRTASLALAIAAVAAPAASADFGRAQGSRSVSVDRVTPDARDAGRPVPPISLVTPDARDNGRREPAPIVVQAPPVAAADRFDWRDAGLGAAGLAALLALAGGTTVVTRRHAVRAS